MNKTLCICILCLFCVFAIPCICLATITFDENGTWETSFECDQWTQGESLDCDGVEGYGSWSTTDGAVGQIVSNASNPLSAGLGFRHWEGDGTNNNSGGIIVEFAAKQKELWVRWYQRYESGFSWSALSYDKMIYVRTGVTSDVIPEFYGNTMRLAAQGTSDANQVQTSDFGWGESQGSIVGSGEFVAYEVYIKMDTNQTDGVGRLWVDGVLRAENTSVDWSNGNATAQDGWAYIIFGSNQATPGNGRDMYVDYDDIAIYTQQPPNTDLSDNHFIGLLSGDVPADPTITTTSGPILRTGQHLLRVGDGVLRVR